MGSIVSCFSNLLYLSEKTVLSLTCLGLICSLVLTFVLSLGMGIGLGYNYCFVDLKTKYKYVPAHYVYPGSPRWPYKRGGNALFPNALEEKDDEDLRHAPHSEGQSFEGMVKITQKNPSQNATPLEANALNMRVNKTNPEGNETTSVFMPSLPDYDMNTTPKSLPSITPQSLPDTTSESLADTTPGSLPNTTTESVPETSLPVMNIRFGETEEQTEEKTEGQTEEQTEFTDINTGITFTIIEAETESTFQMYDENGDPTPSKDLMKEDLTEETDDTGGKRVKKLVIPLKSSDLINIMSKLKTDNQTYLLQIVTT